jgi:SAM-dependent methyltransferase
MSTTPEKARELTSVDLAGHEVGKVWDLCLSAEFDTDAVVSGIAEWLGSPDGLRVLDCACGSGFPALDLHRLGYGMSATDGSAFMLERFRRNAQAAGVELEPRQARWEELGGLYAEAFDVVMCRGCSLIYAGTWDTEAEPDWSALVSAVHNFARCLCPGGRLYVDTTTEEDLLGEYPQIAEYGPHVIDGKRVQWREYLTADPQARTRSWQVSLQIDDDTVEFARKSHYVPHADLVGVLESAGLQGIGRVEIPGERYAVFSARRPPA